MKTFAAQHGFPFPYVIDATQEVGRAYGALCTPDFFGFDRDLKLVYRGRLDASGRSDDPTAARELFTAMRDVARTGATSGDPAALGRLLDQVEAGIGIAPFQSTSARYACQVACPITGTATTSPTK